MPATSASRICMNGKLARSSARRGASAPSTSRAKILNTLSGTATDATGGVQHVHLYIQNGATYWDGAGSWGGALTWLVGFSSSTANPAGATAWSYNSSAVTWADGQSYTIGVAADDKSPNWSGVTTFSVIYDTAVPSSVITVPAPANFYNAANLTTLSGTASADVNGTGASQVLLTIKDITANKCYAGPGIPTPWAVCPATVAAAGGAAWSYAIAASTWTDGHAYNLVSQATDQAGNSESAGAGVNFSIDNTNPVSALTAPAYSGSTIQGSSFTTLSGTANDTWPSR